MASTQRSNIEVFFRVSGTDKARKAFRDLGKAGIDMSRRLAGIGTGLASALADVTGKALVLSKTLGTIGAVGLGALAKGIKETTDSSAELTSIVLALRAINGEIGKAGGQPLFTATPTGGLVDSNGFKTKKTASDLAFIQKVADDAGRSIKDLGLQYIGLQSSASKVGIPLKQTRDLFTGISNASTVLGVSSEATNRAFVALNQIASKGTVAAEELRGQLAEALPGAVPLAAKAYGMSVKQFMDAVGKGQVDASTFIAKFGKALNQEYAGAAVAASNTTRVALGRLKNSFFLAKVAIGNGALDEEFRRIVNSMNDLLKLLTANGAFKRFGQDLASAIRPLADRFEAAVNGGYDFERVLKFISSLAAGLVKGFLAVVTATNKVIAGIGNLRRVFQSYGVAVPQTTELLVGMANAFLRITDALVTRKFTDNGFLDFFVSVYALIEACVFALANLVSPKVGPGMQSLEGTFARMAHWINQLAAAIVTLSTGQVSDVLDETGEGILVWLIMALDKVRQFIAAIKTAWALLSGKGAPEGADIDTQKMFAKRDAFGDLLAGRENAARVNAEGQQIYDPKDLEPLFMVRDIVGRLIDFLWENRGAFAAIFDGATDAIKLVTGALDKLSLLLDPISKALGFESLNLAVGYAVGFLLVFRRVAGVIATLRKGLLACVGAIQSFAATLGLTMPQFLVIAAIIGLISFIVGKIYNNWGLLADEIGNIITLISAGLTDALAWVIRQIGKILSYVPVVGGWLQDQTNGLADKLNEGAEAARKNVYYTSLERTSERVVKNGGKDPYADAGPDGFDAFSFLKDTGVGKLVESLGGKQDETNSILKDIAAQSRQGAANDNIDAELRKAAAEAAGGAGPNGEFSRPVIIYLQDGSQVEMRGRNDDQTIERLAANSAKNRASQTPTWGG